MAEDHKDDAAHGEGGHGGGKHGGHGGGGHAGGAHEEHEGAPEWLISFADNVALMMGFFVILLAMNMDKPSQGGVGGQEKNPGGREASAQMEDFALAMREAFNSKVDINSTDPHEAALVRRLKERASEGGKTKQPGVDGHDHNVQATRSSDWVQPTAVAYFADTESALNDEGRSSLAQVAEQIKGQRWIIEVRGHASASETNGSKERGMKYCYDRTLVVAQELVKNGVEWEQLRLTACADNERATPRANDADGHHTNQRVEIVRTQEQVPGDPYNSPAGPAAPGKPE